MSGFVLLRRAAHFSWNARKVAREAMSSRRRVQQSYGSVAGEFNPCSSRPECVRALKFMTYNVWIHEDVSLERRIRAIGQLIQQHSPDVIMFQEVTPHMIKIFQNSEWHVDNKNTLPADRGSSCIMMSNLPMEEAKWIELDSLDGSKYCVASINVMGRRLVSATCHLKCPSAPQNSSKEMRKNQADELLRKLAPCTNVVVGGDMNWKEDGVADWPLPWVDAWTALRPGEAGNTYDTIRNEMIANNNKVQKRLDRFICKLQDFKLKEIEIIGTEAADDELTLYRNERRPLWPSDHFGLVLTISAK